MKINTIGILTSGGDAPGMNAAVRAVTRAAIIPEEETSVDQLAAFIERGVRKSKSSSIVIVSEKDEARHPARRRDSVAVEREFILLF